MADDYSIEITNLNAIATALSSFAPALTKLDASILAFQAVIANQPPSGQKGQVDTAISNVQTAIAAMNAAMEKATADSQPVQPVVAQAS